jgi:V/A-type H+-transporting ATPase subunit C
VIETHAYAVARVRAKENLLINKKELDTLSCASYQDCLQFLGNKGWNIDKHKSYEDMLSAELNKAWLFVSELSSSKELLAVFLCQNDYHNLKASIKSVVTGSQMKNIFLPQGLVAVEVIFEAVKQNNFSCLPIYMIASATEAMNVLLHTGDGQLCDVILDRDTLKAIKIFAGLSDCEFLKTYSNLLIDFTDIKIAVRACKAKKTKDFLKRAIFPSTVLNIDNLIHAATRNIDELYKYLTFTVYSEAIPALQKSLNAFEKYFNEKLKQEIEKERANPFTIGPIAAYLLSKMQEIQDIKVILSSKQYS